jgi:hypothetical protein
VRGKCIDSAELHTEREQAVRDFRADAAQTDDTDFRADQRAAVRGHANSAIANRSECRAQPPRRGQHQ